MATLLQATSAFSSTIGTAKSVKFATEPTVGSLLLVYAIVRGESATEPEDIQGGWTEIATMYPHIATLAPGRLFSRITDGSEYTSSGGFYLTGEFGPCDTFLATEWDVTGISSATPTSVTGPSSWANLGGPGTVNARQTVTTADLAVMIFHGKTFGFNSFTVASGSTQAILWGDADFPAIMVYRNGAGDIQNGVDWSAAQDGGYEYVSVAFGPGGAGTGLDCAFSATPTTGSAPLEVDFTDETIGDPDGWLWDFGDGDTSTSQNPTHTYTEPGAYTVTLTATRSGDSDECESEVQAFIVVHEAGVFIDWETDGFDIGAHDNVSTNVISWTIRRGSGPEITSASNPGSATLLLKNPSDKYNPYNESSPIHDFLRDGAPVWIGPNVDGTLAGDNPRGLFGGRITDITPIPAGGADESPTVEIMCEDFLGWAQRIPVELPFDEGRSHDELREAALIVGAESRYDLAHEIHTMPLSTADGDLGSILDGLNTATGTRHLAKPENSYTEWFSYTTRNRFWRTDATSDASLSGASDHVTGTDGWRLSADTVINRQRATVTPILFTPGAFTVWQAETLPIELTEDRPYSRIIEFDDVVRNSVLDLASTGDPVVQSFEPFATGAKIELSVAAGDSATVTHLSIEGRLARRLITETAEANDDTSQALPRGVRAGGDLSNEYIGVIATARGLAEHVVVRFGNPQLRPTMTVVNWLPEQFNLDLYDVISFTSPQLKMVARLFEIVGLTHEGVLAAKDADDNPHVLHTVTYVLQECRWQTDPDWFYLDDDPGSLLDDGESLLHY